MSTPTNYACGDSGGREHILYAFRDRFASRFRRSTGLQVAERGGDWSTTSPRVVLAEGPPAMRLGLKNLMSASGIQVVGESGDGERALRLVEEMRPDIVVLDLNLDGETEGTEICRQIKSLPEAPCILLYTAQAFDEDVSSCLLAGAASYVHKCTACEE